MLKRVWYYLAKSTGDKSGKTDSEADIVAIIRLIIVLQAVITNVFIVAGVIRHW